MSLHFHVHEKCVPRKTISVTFYTKVKTANVNKACSFNIYFVDSNFIADNMKYLHIALVTEVVFNLKYFLEFGRDVASYSD